MITCEQCVYWDKGKGAGRCRRNPPGATEDADTRWPWTNCDDWCGQATPRESGSTQPVHEAAQAVVDAWSVWLTSRHMAGPFATLPKGLVLFDAHVGELEKALERMKP